MNRRSSLVDCPLPAGMRATRATRALVALLRSKAASRLTAAETESALARMGVVVNRVTVFRALDRLTQAGMLQRKVDEDRLTRYQWRTDASVAAPAVAPSPSPLPSLQFSCTVCHGTAALDAASPAMAQAMQDLEKAVRQAGVSCLSGLALQGACQACADRAETHPHA